MYPDEKVMCHETAFEKSCFDMVTKCRCRKWVHLTGKNPQSEATFDVWDCRDHLVHFLQMENTQVITQSTATLDKYRKETAEALQKNSDAMIESMRGLIGSVAFAAEGLRREIRGAVHDVAELAAPETARIEVQQSQPSLPLLESN